MTEIEDVAAAQRHLDAFLVENQELETLNARLGAFNLFSVLRVDKAEIRHSNVLGWLLSPNESHGLGPVFLRRFLSRLLLEQDTPQISITPSQIELMDFSDVEVLREWQNIDVLVRSRKHQWCLLIENKIKSKESKGQLVRYMGRVRQEMPGYQVIPVFLTLDGEEPSEEGQDAGFLPLGHAQVLELAEQIVSQHESRIPEDAHTFLDHYLATLRRLTMQDEKLIDLCRAIYRKHREAIDLVVEYGAASNVQDACLQEIESLVDCEFAKAVRGGVWFLPKELGDKLPTQTLLGWSYLPRSVPIAFWYNHRKKRGGMALVLEVGPMEDSAKRIELLKAIRSAGVEVREVGFREKAKFTRLKRVSQKLRVDEYGEPDISDESIQDVAGTLWNKMNDTYMNVVEALRDFEW